MTARIIGVRQYRLHLQAMFRARPDDSHGDGYFNAGITAALRALNVAAFVDMRTPCERVTPPNMGGGWCASHHGWLGQTSRWCELAEAPWTWASDKAVPA